MARRRAVLRGLSLCVSLAACGSSDPPSRVDATVDAPDAVTPDAPDVAKTPDVPPTGDARVRVTRYDVHFDLATRRATSRLTLAVDGAGDCVTLPFRVAQADDVTFDDVAAREVTVADNRLRACGAGWRAGATVTLAATYTEALRTLSPTQVGYSTRNDMAGRPLSYLLSWVGECDRHGPCDNRPDVFARFRFTVAHPMGTRVFCPGTITETETETVCDFDRDGAPTYSGFGFLAGRSWNTADLGTASGVRITLHDVPGTGIGAALHADTTRGFLTWMVDTFGAYPYGDSLRLVAAPTYWAGFEHPGNIALAETLARGRLDHTVMHEIAHQWAGDQTTLAATEDFVWKEAMAEYLTFAYEDDHVDHATAGATAQVWKDTARTSTSYPVPRAPLTLLQFYGAAYGPGPMILFRQLEVMFSRAMVVGALRTLLGRAHAVSVDDVRRALETSTGQSLTGYFDAWLRGDGAPAWPRVTVTREALDGGGVRVGVRVRTADGVARGCRFRVRLQGATGESLDVPIDLGLAGRTPDPVTVTPTFAVTREVIDPERECLVFPEESATTMLAQAPSPTPWLAP